MLGSGRFGEWFRRAVRGASKRVRRWLCARVTQRARLPLVGPRDRFGG